MKVLKLSAMILMLATMVACLPDNDSDYEKIVERDNRLLRDYLDRNGINAIENPLGFFYQKVETNDIGNQIVNNDVIGIYYEIRTTDGQLIDSYFDENKRPRLYKHNDGGLVPRVINFASGIAKEGETLMIYSPSYLAYQQYSFEQLIVENSNLVIKVKYAQVFDNDEVKAMEQEVIEDYLTDNELEDFEITDNGIFIKIIGEGDGEKTAASGDIVAFEFELKQLGEDTAISKTNNNSPITARVGEQGNLDFLNQVLKGLKAEQEIEVYVPSHLAFGGSTQVFPFAIRRDLFLRGALGISARPYEPIHFKAKIKEVR
ncbi:FKBP-type peptidyl-prolyl cis-trans isomerase [Belliella buryatensis]|uniref:Peptidyl-prolyl cis-trans isomerase n=1 Tax=Belliella buryatensis TaxID=1500549 RepID=A0A239B338_9BACT|nr:FKBP-type peptidyl-prolyl cis-trans isomerase [Belliella buryatensis]SNS02375.1 FKBP-type peptidyl-prolyl cis-trans isomerase [Belliella buryatensis]